MPRIITAHRAAALALWLVTAAGLSAQKYSNEFLTIGVGGRAHAMGSAVVATQQDIFATAWNPAGLAGLDADRGLEVGAMHAEWFGGIGNYDFLGFSLPLSNATQRIGISLIRFGIDQIPNTLSLYEADGTINFDRLREFSAADYAFLGTYARTFDRPKSRIRVGGNVKVIYRNIGEFASSYGFGLDLGAQLEHQRWTFGLVARDVTTTFNTWSVNFSESDRAALELTDNSTTLIDAVELTKPTLVLAAAHDFRITDRIGLAAELNLIATTDGQRNVLLSADPVSVDPAFGLEARYSDFVFLRAGVSQFQRIADFDAVERLNSRPSLGLGLRVGQLFVDYAYTDIGSDDGRSSYSHIVSLRLGIRPKG